MAKDDYYLIVYRVLLYLYHQLKAGDPIDPEKLSPQWLTVPESYWEYIFETMSEEGLVRHADIEEDYSGKHLGEDFTISPQGIRFLQENSTFAKIKATVKDLTDIAGNLPLL